MLFDGDPRLSTRGIPILVCEWREVRFLKISYRYGQKAFQKLLPIIIRHKRVVSENL